MKRAKSSAIWAPAPNPDAISGWRLSILSAKSSESLDSGEAGIRPFAVQPMAIAGTPCVIVWTRRPVGSDPEIAGRK
jgi:hypothetical protein